MKKADVQQEASGLLLNNETEKFLSCGEIVKTETIFMSDPNVNRQDAEVIQVDFHKGDKVYYQKTKGYDTHDSDYQVVNITDIIYVEEA